MDGYKQFESSEDFRVVSQLQSDIYAALKNDPNILLEFYDGRSGVIKHRVDDTPSGINHATCTAFCFYYALKSRNKNISSYLKVPDKSSIKKSLSVLGKSIVAGHTARKASSDVGSLPNQYNSPIQIAGYLSAAKKYEEVPDKNLKKHIIKIVDFIIKMVLKNDGFIPRVGTKYNIPSSYLTYWAAAALVEAVSFEKLLSKSCSDKANTAIGLLSRWSEQELSNHIAYHHAGLSSQFDVMELLYSALTSVTFRTSSEQAELTKHGLSILFDKYFSDGCFSPSTPVLADRKNFSLQCPTVEPLALLLNTDRSLLTACWSSLCETYSWLDRHRTNKGWYPEGEGRHGIPTSFMTVSSVTFIVGLLDLLDDILANHASKLLDVPAFAKDSKLDDFDYPEDLSRIIKTHVVTPIKTGNYELASYSMILWGPPGTSKTTIARKLSQEIGWPLLIINQGDFLRKGIENLYAEAEKLFYLTSFLKDTIVLFDEIEELVVDRDSPDKSSRMLTTSMLPRIHNLRDRKRIIFIFATNHVESIDNAVTRLGRFDILHCVMPPSEAEVKKFLNEFIKKDGVSSDVRKSFEEHNVYKKANGLGYLDLKTFVRHIRIAKEIDGTTIDGSFVDTLLEKTKLRIKSDVLEKFSKKKKETDRP